MAEPKLDEHGNPIVASAEGNEPTAPVTPPKAVEPAKLQLTADELDAIKAKAVADAQAESEERIRLEEAQRNGDYKILAEQSEAKLKEVNLLLWRTKALNKFKLPESFSAALVGDTEKEILSCAKKLKEDWDAEVTERVKTEGEHITTPDPGRTNPPSKTGHNAEAVIRSNMGAALGIGRQIRQIRH